MHDLFGLSLIVAYNFTNMTPRSLSEASAKFTHLKSLWKEKYPNYYISISIAVITPPSIWSLLPMTDEARAFLPWPTRFGHFFSVTDEAGIMCSWPMGPNTLDPLWDLQDEARYICQRLMRLWHSIFHLFVLMHTWAGQLNIIWRWQWWSST